MVEKMQLGIQIWCSRDEGAVLDLSRVKPVKNMYRKPFGGFWTSTYTPNEEHCSEWIEWMCYEMPEWATGNCYILEPEENIKVYEVDDADDLEKLFEKYPLKIMDKYFDVDWEKACEDYDAIHLTSRGQWDTRYKTPTYGSKLNLYGWDSESTLWCRPRFKNTAPIEDIKDRKCKIICD